MDDMQWLGLELERSGRAFGWALRQVPEERLVLTPPSGLGEWPALRHLHHLVWYERELALPWMRLWLGEPALDEDALDEAAAWTAEGPALTVEEGLRSFAAGRDAQVALLAGLDPDAWTATRRTGWGDVPLRWIVTKTYQHTAEHINDVLRIALFWDAMEETAAG